MAPRIFNVDHLRNICGRLGWQVVEAALHRGRPSGLRRRA
jgi:hypothetical protein